MRKQAEEMESLLYLCSRWFRKITRVVKSQKLLTTSSSTRVSDVYNSKIQYVKDTESAEEVARFMQKYDLFEVPVVDKLGKLVGRITVDDVIDFITEEAEKRLPVSIRGFLKTVDSSDTIFI